MKEYVLSQSALTKDPRFPQNDPENKRYRRRILAEGDSWFSLGSVPAENMLLELDFPERTVIVNIAKPGDEIVRMGDPNRAKVFKRLVAGIKSKSYVWDVILLSGGGNDLIDCVGDILKAGNSVDACIRQSVLQDCMRAIGLGYRSLASMRDAPGSRNTNCPMIGHTYDYLTPRNAPALCFAARYSSMRLMAARRARSGSVTSLR